MGFIVYIIIMSMATVAAWFGWIIALVSIDPTRTGATGIFFFYLILSIALIGTLTIGGTGIRYWFNNREPIEKHVIKSLRQGILLSTLIIGSLLMLSVGLFRWWTVIIFIVFLSFVELAFLSAEHANTEYN